MVSPYRKPLAAFSPGFGIHAKTSVSPWAALAKAIRPLMMAAAKRFGTLMSFHDPRLDALIGDRARIALLAAVDFAARVGLRRNCKPEPVATLFPELSSRRVLHVAAAIERHDVIRVFIRRSRFVWGEAWIERTVEIRGAHLLARLRGTPVLMVGWHAGLNQLLPAALAQWGRDGVMLLHDPGPVTRTHGLELLATVGGAQKRALNLLRAAQVLRSGKAALVLAGVGERPLAGSSPTLSFLGREVYIAPGIAVLARLSGAALVPAEGRLEGSRLIVEIFDPLETGPHDHDTTRTMASFFEQRILADPSSLWPGDLRLLAAAPHLGGPQTGHAQSVTRPRR